MTMNLFLWKKNSINLFKSKAFCFCSLNIIYLQKKKFWFHKNFVYFIISFELCFTTVCYCNNFVSLSSAEEFVMSMQPKHNNFLIISHKTISKVKKIELSFSWHLNNLNFQYLVFQNLSSWLCFRITSGIMQVNQILLQNISAKSLKFSC